MQSQHSSVFFVIVIGTFPLGMFGVAVCAGNSTDPTAGSMVARGNISTIAGTSNLPVVLVVVSAMISSMDVSK